jgi:hypothetical protein
MWWGRRLGSRGLLFVKQELIVEPDPEEDEDGATRKGSTEQQ